MAVRLLGRDMEAISDPCTLWRRRTWRATSAAGPWDQVAGVVGTSYLDADLDPLTTYFYKVRAATGEACISSDSAVVSAITVACQTLPLYANSFETGSGLSDWTVAELNGPGSAASWRGIQSCTAKSGTRPTSERTFMGTAPPGVWSTS